VTSKLALWAPVLAYMALIFWVSSMPQPPDLPVGLSELSDKALHAIVYAGLAALMVRALAGGWLRRLTISASLIAVALTTAYGVTDELHQYFVPPRQMDPRDLLADALGASAASLVLHLLARRRPADVR
jgi:VanZ family protein